MVADPWTLTCLEIKQVGLYIGPTKRNTFAEGSTSTKFCFGKCVCVWFPPNRIRMNRTFCAMFVGRAGFLIVFLSVSQRLRSRSFGQQSVGTGAPCRGVSIGLWKISGVSGECRQACTNAGDEAVDWELCGESSSIVQMSEGNSSQGTPI